jgi:hypothetical protein
MNECAKHFAITAVIGLLTTAAFAKNNVVSCSGTMIDVDLDQRMDFPYAAVYDADNYRTCMLDRGPAGHDPLRGVCNAGQQCAISGPYKRRVRDTYFLRFGDPGVNVKGKPE